MPLIEPGSGKPICGVKIPLEFYWIAETPVRLAGMKYPRDDFPWIEIAKMGFTRVVALKRPRYSCKPLTVLAAEELEDLCHGGPPRDADGERRKIREIVTCTVSALNAGDGVVVHCVGGRGRTGTVIGCALGELGYGSEEVVEFLDRVHKARGKDGWPESLWQENLVRDWPSAVP